MEQFFEKYEVAANIRASIQNVMSNSNVDFYSLNSNTLFTIFKDEVDMFPRFFDNYKLEKEINRQTILSIEPCNQSTNTQNENLDENSTQAKNGSSIDDFNVMGMEIISGDGQESDSEDEEEEVTQPTADVEHSTHSSLPDNFQYKKNYLYTLLFDDLDGKVILAKYKNKKILLERRLKRLIIKKFITENSISYRVHGFTVVNLSVKLQSIKQRIRASRFLDIKTWIKELFPSLSDKQLDHWYSARKTNIRGETIRCSGALYNFYRTYRCELAETGLVKLKKSNNPGSVVVEPSIDPKNLSCLVCLFYKEEGQYDVLTVSKVWGDSFETRMRALIDSSSKKVVQIRYTAYLNRFGCLKRTFGLSLLLSDSSKIIEHLYKNKKISEDTSVNFHLNFVNLWPELAEYICRAGDSSNSGDVRDFRAVHGKYLTQIPVEIRGLMYLPYILSKATTVKTVKFGEIKLEKQNIANHFIAFIQNESQLDEKKNSIIKELERLEIDVHPFIIFCGQLPVLTKAYVIINSTHFEFEKPLEAVDQCFRASVALHTWSKFLHNTWVFIQEEIYKIKVGTSIALISKAHKVVDNLQEKIKKLKEPK